MPFGALKNVLRRQANKTAERKNPATNSADDLDDSLYSGVTFAQHSKDGALFTGVNASWSVLWSAPKTLSPVTIYAAGNASNGDDSALGDVILLFKRTIEPIS